MDEKRTSKALKTTKAQDALIEIIQAATGMVSSKRTDFVKDISHIIQRGIQGRLAEGFAEELRVLKARGKVKEDYDATDQSRQEISYLFSAIKTDGPIDEKQFNAMKNIYLNSAKEVLSSRDSPLPVELMRICSTLNMGEVIVLETAYRLSKETLATPGQKPRYTPSDVGSWPKLIAEESGLGIEDMVTKYEQTLIEKGLLNSRTSGGNVKVDTNYHLSGMGLKLCEFILNTDISFTEES